MEMGHGYAVIFSAVYSTYTTTCNFTRHLVSALLIIHKPFTPFTVRLIVHASSFLAKWLEERVRDRDRVRVRIGAREWPHFFFLPSLFFFFVVFFEHNCTPSGKKKIPKALCGVLSS